MITIWVAPHERMEAIKAYRDKLGLEDIAQIMNAPEGQSIQLVISACGVMWINPNSTGEAHERL